MVQLSSDAPVVVSHPRKGSNNQVDFIRFLLCLIEDGHLQSGDILIVDNASVHAGRATNSMLLDLLTANNVKLIFLPTYSPELNPIELVFGWVKRYLHENSSDQPLLFDIKAAFSLVTPELVKKCYYKCLFEF